MPYLIDGHNLIPKLGLRLDSFDDEMELVQLLQEFCRLGRRQVEVYFDNAPPGYPVLRKIGMVSAHFVQKPQIADEAIRQRVKKLGKAAQNWTVVSSDHRVQAEARAMRAQLLDSEDFARELRKVLQSGGVSAKSERKLSDSEVNEWLDIFKKK